MARDRQITANRLNARKSTGPRSIGGKKRAGRNAYRHGLSVSVTAIGTFATALDDRARKFAGHSQDPIVLGHARAAAAAELDLARARLAKVGLIERARVIDPTSTMPSQEPDRSAEAVRRVLPELHRLDRYERRASARRDQAVRDLLYKTGRP